MYIAPTAVICHSPLLVRSSKFFIRDITKVGKKERLAAGIVSTIVGGAFIIWQETSDGASLDGSILRVAISIVAAIVVVRIYNHWKEGRTKTKQNTANQKGNSFTGTIADEAED